MAQVERKPPQWGPQADPIPFPVWDPVPWQWNVPGSIWRNIPFPVGDPIPFPYHLLDQIRIEDMLALKRAALDAHEKVFQAQMRAQEEVFQAQLSAQRDLLQRQQEILGKLK